jgi:hypothetical protein
MCRAIVWTFVIGGLAAALVLVLWFCRPADILGVHWVEPPSPLLVPAYTQVSTAEVACRVFPRSQFGPLSQHAVSLSQEHVLGPAGYSAALLEERGVDRGWSPFVQGEWRSSDPAWQSRCEQFIFGPPDQPFLAQFFQDWFLFHNFFKHLGAQYRGVYVDVGANHPTEFSNSAFFDKCLGWRGVCIEPQPGTLCHRFPCWRGFGRYVFVSVCLFSSNVFQFLVHDALCVCTRSCLRVTSFHRRESSDYAVGIQTTRSCKFHPHCVWHKRTSVTMKALGVASHVMSSAQLLQEKASRTRCKVCDYVSVRFVLLMFQRGRGWGGFL